jgi:hypothetical protein
MIKMDEMLNFRFKSMSETVLISSYTLICELIFIVLWSFIVNQGLSSCLFCGYSIYTIVTGILYLLYLFFIYTEVDLLLITTSRTLPLLLPLSFFRLVNIGWSLIDWNHKDLNKYDMFVNKLFYIEFGYSLLTIFITVIISILVYKNK